MKITHTPVMSWLTLTCFVAGCSLAPPVPDPKVNVPALYKESGPLQAAALEGQWKIAQPAAEQDRGAWWTIFNDKVLNALEEQASEANSNLAAAAMRVQQARALLQAAEADSLPQLDHKAAYERGKSAAVEAGLPATSSKKPGSTWRSKLFASYEVDLFNRIDNRINAVRADKRAVEANFRSALLALQADVAQLYYELRTLDAELDLLQRTIDLRKDNLRITDARFKAGDIAELDVARTRTDLATVETEMASVRGTRERTEHALAILLGRPPVTYRLVHSPLSIEMPIPYVPAGLPSSLLERRPDIAIAQERIMAATARVGEARAALFPSLVLTSNAGYAAYQFVDLFKWSSRTWLVATALALPLFDGGRNRAHIRHAQDVLKESVEVYRQSVLSAFGDVEDKLSTLNSVRDQNQSLQPGLAAVKRASELADQRYRAGTDSYVVLIDVQREQLLVERRAIQIKGAWVASTIGLIRALGGGWDTTELSANPIVLPAVIAAPTTSGS